MRFSSKKILFASALALGFVFTGCLTEGDDKDGALKVSALSNVSIAYGDSIKFDAKASGGTAPYTYAWYAAVNGDTVKVDSSASIRAVAKVDEVIDGMKIWLVVTDSKGAKVTSSVSTVTVVFKATADTLTLGAQANATVGSVLDLDSGKVWTSAVANANQNKIDLVYLYYNGKASLNGALAAKDSGTKYEINLTNGYTTAQNVQFVKVSAKPASVSAASAAYLAGPRIRSSEISVGDKFVVLSTAGRYFFVEVRSVTGTTAGTAGFSFAAGEIGAR